MEEREKKGRGRGKKGMERARGTKAEIDHKAKKKVFENETSVFFFFLLSSHNIFFIPRYEDKIL